MHFRLKYSCTCTWTLTIYDPSESLLSPLNQWFQNAKINLKELRWESVYLLIKTNFLDDDSGI